MYRKSVGAMCTVTGMAMAALSIHLAAATGGPVDAEGGPQGTTSADSATTTTEVVPSNHARSSLLKGTEGPASPGVAFGQEVRTIDGTGNNAMNPDWGSAGTQLLRLAPADYGDGASTPAGADRPSARFISNTLCRQSGAMPNALDATDFVWQWGQFLDHDLDLAEIAEPAEPFDIEVPTGDPAFDPQGTGRAVIELDRAAYDPLSNPRQQINFITSFIDASNVYGSDPIRAAALRRNDGTGKLATSAGDLLPFNTAGLPNAGGPSETLFLAGDVRANEQVGLSAMHTLFVREHNRLCDEIAADEPGLTGEELYQRARAIVGAEIQVITYKEFLPVVLGPDALTPYAGYDPSINPGIANVFATACYRLGHSMLSSTIQRLDENNQEIPEGHLPLLGAFFNPSLLIDEGGIEPLLRGLAAQQMQLIDNHVVDDVRDFLFGPPGRGGLDLASLNIQRGRDHGLPDYNAVRVAYGLPAVSGFDEITSSTIVQARLEFVYGTVDDIDAWIGTLCEDPIPGALVGPTLMAVLGDQFERLRDGDRFWYQNFFTGAQLAELEAVRLSDIIRRNTSIGDEIQDDVFRVETGVVPATSGRSLLILALALCIAGILILRSKSRRPMTS